MIRRSSITLLVSLAILQACTSVPNRPGFDDIRSDIEARIGEEIIWDRNNPSVQAAISAMKAEPLTEDNAVRLALLQSPALQAEYKRLRISYADVVQAGLLTNPQLDVTSGFGLDGGATRVGAGLVYNFLEFLTRRGNVEAASYGFEKTKAEIVGAVTKHTIAVRRTYSDYITTRDQLALAEDRAELANTRRLTARRLYAADEVDVSRVSLEEQAYLNVNSTIEMMKAELISARETLRVTIGLKSLDSIQMPQTMTLRDVPFPTFDVARMLALDWRHDLIAARADMRRLQALVRQQRRGPIVNSAAAGVELEREDGENFIGPSVSLQLPVFDQGQAQIARTAAAQEQADYRLEQLELQVLADLRTAIANADAANTVFALQEGQKIPSACTNLQLSEQLFAAGEVDIFDVFDARENLLDARLNLINAGRAFRQATYALNEAIGGEAPPR